MFGLVHWLPLSQHISLLWVVTFEAGPGAPEKEQIILFILTSSLGLYHYPALG